MRLKPSSQLLPIVADVYGRVLADEAAAAEEGLSRDAVVDVGLASLTKEIESLGFADYTAFMQHALAAEMTSRQQRLSQPILPIPMTPRQRMQASDQQRIIEDLTLDT